MSNMNEKKAVRANVRRLPPSTDYLFGGKVTEVAKDLKDSMMLDPLAKRPSFRGRGGFPRGRGYSNGGHRSYGHGGGSYGYGGGPSADYYGGGSGRGSAGGEFTRYAKRAGAKGRGGGRGHLNKYKDN